MRRFDTDTLVIASHNEGKIQEIRALLEPFGIKIRSVSAFGLTEPEETEDTFTGNARVKAHFAAQNTGFPAISDDSGIEVDALGGKPGVYTADWAETPSGRDFPSAMTRVWNELNAIDAKPPRTARFCCTLCLAWPDGHDEVFAGTVEGQVVWPMRGELGFGFDPCFMPDGESVTFGEMVPNKKHGMSHRAHAFAKLVAGCFA